jgi:hydrogenase maturation protease
MDSPRRTLVIGYGSPIRGDDAIGPMVADRLDDGTLPDAVRVISRHILTADLVPDIVEAGRVIFVDAEASGEPGSVRCRSLQPDGSTMSTMAHFLDPRELLAWADSLYGHRPEAFLLTVAGGEFGFSHFALSEAVERSLPRVLEEVRALVDGVGVVGDLDFGSRAAG